MVREWIKTKIKLAVLGSTGRFAEVLLRFI